MRPEQLLDRYGEALSAFLRSNDRSLLPMASDLGEQVPMGQLPMGQVITAHHTTLLQHLDAGTTEPLIQRASAFLAAFLRGREKEHQELLTAHHAALNQLRAMQQLPEVLVERIPAITYVAVMENGRWEMLYMGPQVELVLGFSPSDWINNPQVWHQQLHPEDRDRVLEERATAQAIQEPFVAEYRLLARDGREVWIHDEATASPDEEEATRYWLGVMFDITARKTAEASAVAAERNRLARELHDSATQTIMSASMLARVLPALWQRDPVKAQQQVAELENLTTTALAELRSLLVELRPAAIIQTPLDQLLRQLVASIGGRTQALVDLHVVPTRDLPPEVQIAYYRIAQEALNNIAEHSKADRVSVRLEKQGERLILAVEDNGRGFDLAQLPPDHFGVRIIQERAISIGGRLRIESGQGRGTRLRLVWPETI